MIISFAVENWMSFRDRTTFSMVASRERQHGERLPKLAKYNTRILPLAAIYGGNASGKTNFFKALSFAKTLVVKGTQPDSHLAVDGFRLDDSSADRPCAFTFELLIDETIYEFAFSCTRKVIVQETLAVISSTSERVLYSRQGNQIHFDGSLKKDQFLQFAFKGTRENQLFLTNSVSQKVENFRSVYDWFKDTLELVAPDSRFEPFEQFLDDGHPLYATMNQLLPQLDTGIAHLGGEQIPLESTPLPDAMKTMLQEEVKEGMTIRLMSDKNERLVFTRRDGQLISKKLVTFHPKLDGTEAKFEIRQESDGTQRVIDLLPAFLELAAPGSRKVFVIDEVDRSLHTLLTKRLIEAYLASCSAQTRAQLLMTTHDLLLMDQHLLRRDEMWIAERERTGQSTLTSFADYKDVRYDKDIRKSYLQGRLGGVPKILLNQHLVSSPQTKSSKKST